MDQITPEQQAVLDKLDTKDFLVDWHYGGLHVFLERDKNSKHWSSSHYFIIEDDGEITYERQHHRRINSISVQISLTEAHDIIKQIKKKGKVADLTFYRLRLREYVEDVAATIHSWEKPRIELGWNHCLPRAESNYKIFQDQDKSSMELLVGKIISTPCATVQIVSIAENHDLEFLVLEILDPQFENYVKVGSIYPFSYEETRWEDDDEFRVWAGRGPVLDEMSSVFLVAWTKDLGWNMEIDS